MFVRLSIIGRLALLVMVLTSTNPARAAVFGTDDRTDVPATLQPAANALGLLFHARARSVCTAFCVAPDIIATAAHCLFRTQGQSAPRLAEFWFTRGAAVGADQPRSASRLAGHLTGAVAQQVTAGSTRLAIAPPIDATFDWALARLARPVCTGHLLAVTPLSPEAILAASDLGRISQLAFHRDRQPWRPLWSKPCPVARQFGELDWPAITADFAAPAALILHTCDTGGASSGSPLLLTGPDGPQVVGINVGTYVSSRVLVREGRVMQRSAPEPVANTAVAATAFAERLTIFRGATILSSEAAVRDLQSRLAAVRVYTGPIDGRYGDTVRAAIEAYERSAGLPVTGLATAALLRRLRATP